MLGFLVNPSWYEANLMVFAAVALLVGLPHGAVDLFLELGPSGVPQGRALVRQLLVYLLAVTATLATIIWYPVLGVGTFLAISAWHFGSGESAFNACRRGRVPRLAPAETVSYSAPLTVVPIVLWRDQVREFIDPLGGSGVTDALTGPAWVVAVVATAAMGYTVVRKAMRRHWTEIGELVLLWAAAVVLPPLALFSVYFALWHSPRHVIRTLPELPGNRGDLSRGHLFRGVLRYLAYTVPGTVGALAIFAALLVINNDTMFVNLHPATWAGALLAALTMPHALTILRYDLWLNRIR
ncbi:beta-carotene 15,15'-dioxygenase [Lentzea flava]|uniref:Probable beta-carotene 15,15'-dioxygenase n=2 Tax=Lentzea flava TaxID=103732 RepID=A0ABQ2VGB4_9PSEU|nr:beta-carotene 15,15'-dioxygenase [Lentzea flava]